MTELERYIANGGEIKRLPIAAPCLRFDRELVQPEPLLNEKSQRLYKWCVNGVKTDDRPDNIIYIPYNLVRYLILRPKSRAFYLSYVRGPNPLITRDFIQFMTTQRFSIRNSLHESFNIYFQKYLKKNS